MRQKTSRLSSLRSTEDSSPDDTETQNSYNTKKMTAALTFRMMAHLKEEMRSLYFKTPAEEITNKHYRKHAIRYEGARQGPSRDSSPYPQNRPRANSMVDNEMARSSTSPISPPTPIQAHRRATLDVPQAVYPGRGRSTHVVSTSSQPRDDFAICVEPEEC